MPSLMCNVVGRARLGRSNDGQWCERTKSQYNETHCYRHDTTGLARHGASLKEPARQSSVDSRSSRTGDV